MNIRPRTTAARFSSAPRLAPVAKSRTPRCEFASNQAHRTRRPFIHTRHHNSLRDAIPRALRWRSMSVLPSSIEQCRVEARKRNLSLSVRKSCAGERPQFRQHGAQGRKHRSLFLAFGAAGAIVSRIARRWHHTIVFAQPVDARNLRGHSPNSRLQDVFLSETHCLCSSPSNGGVFQKWPRSGQGFFSWNRLC